MVRSSRVTTYSDVPTEWLRQPFVLNSTLTAQAEMIDWGSAYTVPFLGCGQAEKTHSREFPRNMLVYQVQCLNDLILACWVSEYVIMRRMSLMIQIHLLNPRDSND